MKIIMEYEYPTEQELEYESLAALVADAVLDAEKCPYEAQISLVLTDDAEIHRINREFRQIDRPTDVLSFPMIPFEKPADYTLLETDEGLFDPDSGELILGDIMISVDRLHEQSREYGHSLKREYCFLVAHSVLHLLGYDHESPEEAAVMEEKQEAVLEGLGITRDS